MVDSKIRKSLSQDIRRLVAGRMTNDAFDDVYYESYDSSEDRAVREVSAFCYGLYSSDLLMPYRLRDRYAVDEETRATAARCVLFLRSGREYEWPDKPDDPSLRILAGLATSLGIPAGIAVLLVCILVAFSGEDELTAQLAIVGVLLLAVSSAVALFWPRFLAKDWKYFENSGDYDVWPFIRRKDFDKARATCHLFAK